MSSSTKMFTVDKFLGIDEAADGYTELKMGQASRMENFYITDAFNLKSRPGIARLETEQDRTAAPILGLWSGHVGEKQYLVVADFFGGKDRIRMYAKDAGSYALEHSQAGALGLTAAEDPKLKIFPFGGKLYIMSKENTVIFRDGRFAESEPYVPLVITGAVPSGAGTTLEGINLLSALRRMDFSADGEATVYRLPEEAAEVESITVDGKAVTTGSFDTETHCYTFSTAPDKGVGNVEFTYRISDAEAEKNKMRVINMTLVEAYNGSTDTRLFFAGDGSNICLYTGLPQSGDVTALYVPAMNEVAVDMSDSPVTGLVRHYSKLLVYKPDGAYTITYEPVTLTDGNTIAGFYLRSANREFGNELLGQIQTVDNYPRTITRGGIYEWRITSSYYQYERYAKRVSGPVENSLAAAWGNRIVTCDDNYSKTYYVFLNDEEGTVLVNRYALNRDGLWMLYKSSLCRDVRWAVMLEGSMLFASDTEIFCFRENLTKDAPAEEGGEDQRILAVWESGYMDFGADFRKKYSSRIYISMLPESNSVMTVTASTDRRETYMEKAVGNNLFGWESMNFAAFSFNMNSTPRIRRIQLKVKKFVYYKLIFRVEEPGARATVLGYDQQVRFSSLVK